jgi:nucleotide-binding universal stress UspA family protein
MTKIIAFVDGSIYSRSVCDHAAWAASRTGAAAELLHVLGRREAPAKADLSGSIRLGARSALLVELAELDVQPAKLVQHRGRAILDDARAILDKAGVLEITTRLRHGDIVETVAEQEKGPEMILVGKRGEAADFARLHLGSYLERIARANTKPILVASRAFQPVEKLLIAYEGRTTSMKAVDHVARSPALCRAGRAAGNRGAETAEAKKGLADAQALLRGAGIEAEAVIAPGQPYQVLARMVDEEGFDLLVMGAYRHSRIRSLIIGSTTTEMLRSCKIPVVLVR